MEADSRVRDPNQHRSPRSGVRRACGLRRFDGLDDELAVADDDEPGPSLGSDAPGSDAASEDDEREGSR